MFLVYSGDFLSFFDQVIDVQHRCFDLFAGHPSRAALECEGIDLAWVRTAAS